jgi:hypothetical protein
VDGPDLKPWLRRRKDQKIMARASELALAAEDDLGKVLWTNIGLDAGYMFAGGTMIAAGAFGAEPAVDWQSHGAGIVMQGAGLLVLDGIAVWSSGPREEALQTLPPAPAP